MNPYVVIDIGGTSIKYGLADAKGQLLETHEMPTEAQKGGPHILNTTKEIVARYLKKHPLAGVAISSAGMVDPDKGEIFYAGPQIPNYAGTQFKKEIEETFQIPCEIENDVNCAGLAEVTTGHAKGSNNAVCLTIGTGIGGCLLLDGQVFHGFSNSACEVGYLHLPDGAFQDLASTTSMWQNIMVILWNSGMVAGSSSRQLKEIRSVWLELIGWWPISEKDWPISPMWSIQRSSFLEGGLWLRKPSSSQKSIKPCVPNWFLA